MDKISLVVPCYNEEETIRIFYNEVLKYESQLDAELEFCFVDDGSHDHTLDILKESDSNLLSSDIIICKAFATYKDYNSQVIRTFMIDSNKSQQNQYKILLTAFDKILNSIKKRRVPSKNNPIARDPNAHKTDHEENMVR